jgi:flavin-dependent dehydrogenase
MLKVDVAIIGGGPAGSTVATLLKKYNPSLKVVVIEREQFPRDHVGESHLPAISTILNEMGVWEKVEKANFPIKIGATFKWGAQKEFWHTDFLQHQQFEDAPRPGKYEGQRTKTAFQVDRSQYDKVLLDHAKSMGCRVFEQTKVSKIERDGDRVTGFLVSTENEAARREIGADGRIEARYYVDCSGEAGILRKAFEVETEYPTALRNIAFWKYWRDTGWAVTIGNGGTRVQVMSLSWGWVWFIPITPTRTSIGLVLPASYYKASGKSLEELYNEAISTEPLVSSLIKDANPEAETYATKDWNFLSSRLVGENWFLAGDSCGFADPILSAGVTLAQTSARKVAFTILELDREVEDPAWVKSEYEDGHRAQIRHHMQFADFWYSSNGQFTELREYCTEIAATAGISLGAEDAFWWLATGGFTIDQPGVAAALTYRVGGLKMVACHLDGSAPDWVMTKTNSWRLDLEGAKEDRFVRYINGRVTPIPCLRRGAKILPIVDVFKHLSAAFKVSSDALTIVKCCVNAIVTQDKIPPQEAALKTIEAIEALILEGWIKTDVVANRPFVKV